MQIIPFFLQSSSRWIGFEGTKNSANPKTFLCFLAMNDEIPNGFMNRSTSTYYSECVSGIYGRFNLDPI